MAITNTDDHLRNHAFLLTPKGWTLSPLYDDTAQDTDESNETAQTETDADTPKEMVSVTLNEVAHSIFTLLRQNMSGE